MGYLGSQFGTSSGNSGDAGMNYKAGEANVGQAANTQQAQDLYGQAQSGIAQQQAFLQALQAQNGVGNQSDVFNQQQALAAQFQGVADGTGPNPAQAALNQATANNVSTQAALMAGQRGAGQNVGMLARQAAQQGANTQQQAAGQGATMQATQSLNAMQGLQNQQANMANLATQQVGQQANATTGLNQTIQSEQANILGAIANQNNALVSNQNSQNAANAAVAGKTAEGQQKGTLSKLGFSMAEGGVVPKFADGGMAAPMDQSMPQSLVQPMMVQAPQTKVASPAVGGVQSMFGQALTGAGTIGSPEVTPVNMQPSGPASEGTSLSSLAKMGNSPDASSDSKANMAGGDSAPIMSAGAGEKEGGMDMGAIMQMAAMAAAQGGKVPSKPVVGEQLAAQGKLVPGNKKVPAKGKNNYANDTVSAKLTPGEIVLPVSVTESADPVGNAAKFVHAVLMKQSGKKAK